MAQVGQDDISPQVNNIISEMEQQEHDSSGGVPQYNPNYVDTPQQQQHNGQGSGRQQQGQNYQEPMYEDDMYEEEQFYDGGPMMRSTQPMSMTDLVLQEAKLPILVVLLVFLSNMALLNKTIIQYVPKVVGVDGNLNMLGLLFKAVVAGVVFYLVKRFLL